jgi:hypothetical protein
MSKKQTLCDYAITVQDSTGRRVVLAINADCIRELVATGETLASATEGVESNAFWNAIDRGEIGADAHIV